MIVSDRGSLDLPDPTGKTTTGTEPEPTFLMRAEQSKALN